MGKYKIKFGKVISDHMDKTRVIMLSTLSMHPKYKKRIWKKKKIFAHDEKNSSQIGDYVKVCETRPLSKNKTWRILSIVKKEKV